jgi:serine/threonine-protein kinase RsbW
LYRSQVAGNRLRITFSGDLKHVERACAEIKEMIAQSGAAGCLFACQLLFREAANNAVLHGNAENPAKRIKISLDVRDKQISLAIIDEGDGFDWRAAFNQLPNLEATSGRGFVIMRDYATRISFNRKGNGVNLIISRK